jgi:histidinol-phosphate aminotransferase
MLCAVLGMKARPIPLTEAHEMPTEALLSAVTDETRAVILCNPNNPTGTYLSLDEVREVAAVLPADVLLLLDEAYVEFVEDPYYRNSHALALEKDNVVVARTFSKAHGLAGLRTGYGIASERIADYAERVRFPVSVNLAAQVAATASMLARDKVTARAEFVIRERKRLQETFQNANLGYVPSQGNFVMVRFEADAFERSGILVREGAALGYPGWSRVTVGNSEENDRVILAVESSGRAAEQGAERGA